MGLLDKLFKKAEGNQFSLLNSNLFNIKKNVNDYLIDIYKDGEYERSVHVQNILICNENLSSDWFYKMNHQDTIPTMAECTISESSGVFYIKCNTWVPACTEQFPSRIPLSNKINIWSLHSKQAFIRMTANGLYSIVTSDGEYLDIEPDNIIWTNNPDDYYSWYLCRLSWISANMINVTVTEEALSCVDVIVNGAMLWDQSKLEWVKSKE